ncbi:MAG: fumarate hydratase [Spirochaetes bacterium]|nr:fumarate hydratase [Spirochaetota bacterium]
MSHDDPFLHLDFGEPEFYERLDIEAPKRRKDKLVVDEEKIFALSERAFSEIAFRYPKGHLEKLSALAKDENASTDERFVAETLIRNAAAAARGLYPMCQDTGTALVYGWKGGLFQTPGSGGDAKALAAGAAAAWAAKGLRNSQLGPLSALEEKNTQDNLPAGIDIREVEGSEYRFLFAAKGGGSTSKFSLSMEPPSILDETRLERILAARIGALGASACPPYTIGIVLGGTSPSQVFTVLELAVYGMFDALPEAGDGKGGPLRSREWEKRILGIAEGTGIGAQWGGKGLALDARFIRLSRHAANLPLAVGVSCSAHRKRRAIVNEQGWFLEKLEEDPERLLQGLGEGVGHGADKAVDIDLDAPKEVWLSRLRDLEPGTRVSLSGMVTVARDKAHARIAASLARGEAVPSYFVEHPIFYAGPTEAAPGEATGSFGPTTASRMDVYLSPFTAAGASLVTIAKGGRGSEARAALASARGVYLAAIGGAAALTAKEHIVESRVIDFHDLGMEAVRLVRLRSLPALVVIDARGDSFYP